MVCPQGERFAVKVLDFGLAKATREATNDTSLTHHGAMMGTPDYVAPEQAADARNADIRSDIYSLGCTLYHLLSGRPPFPSPSLYETLQGHAAAKAKPLDLLQTDVPPALAGVVARMMAKDPLLRYQTPQEVANALAPFVFPAHSEPAPGESPATARMSPQQAPAVPGAATVVPAPDAEPSTAHTPAARRTVVETQSRSHVDRPGHSLTRTPGDR